MCICASLALISLNNNNNNSELTIRNAVLLRKISFGSQSIKSVSMAAIFLTVFATLKLNGINPVDFLLNAIKLYIKTNSLHLIPFKFTFQRLKHYLFFCKIQNK